MFINHFNFQTSLAKRRKNFKLSQVTEVEKVTWQSIMTSQSIGNTTNNNTPPFCTNKTFLQILLTIVILFYNVSRHVYLDWNKLMHVYNGNIRHLQVLHQNLPGKIVKSEDIGIFIDIILDIHKSQVLFLSEVDAREVEQHCPENYKFIPGKQNNSSKIRMSALIHKNVQYRVVDNECDIPMVTLVVDGWTLVGFYREWRKCGIAGTDTIEQQQDRLQDFLKLLKKIKGNKIYIGDANLNLLYSDTHHYRRLEPLKKQFVESLANNGMVQLIKESTRDVGGKAILDHVYISNPKFLEHVINHNTVATDHSCVGLKIRSDKPVFQSEVFYTRNINKVTEDDFAEVWFESNPREIFKEPDPDRALAILEFKITRVLNILAPVRKVKTRENYSPWLTESLKYRILRRNQLREKAVASQLDADWKAYKMDRNKVKNYLREAKQKYFNEYFNVQDDKQKWSRVKMKTGLDKKKEVDDMVINDGEKLIKDPELVSNFMNKFFKTKVKNLQARVSADPEEALNVTRDWFSNRKQFKSCGIKTVSTSAVRKIILGLKNTEATGRDKISTKILKKFAYILSPAIRHVINLSIMSSVFPEGWKIGVITPLPKSGDKTDPRNWRPIVINCALSKVYEVVINSQIVSHMETNAIFSDSQFAYRARRGCGPAWQDLDTQIQQFRNEGLQVALILTDQSAAFNVIRKEILVPKLSSYGFDESTCKLITNYLTSRKTMTKVDTAISEPIELDSGVGEGSVVGPTIFICGLCDVPSIVKIDFLTEKENFVGNNRFILIIIIIIYCHFSLNKNH